MHFRWMMSKKAGHKVRELGADCKQFVQYLAVKGVRPTLRMSTNGETEESGRAEPFGDGAEDSDGWASKRRRMMSSRASPYNKRRKLRMRGKQQRENYSRGGSGTIGFWPRRGNTYKNVTMGG